MFLMNCRILILWLPLWHIIPCHGTSMSHRLSPVQRTEPNVVLKVSAIRTKVVTNEWNTWNLWRIFYKWFLNIIKSFGGETGYKNSGTFLQRRVPRDVQFPCQRYMQRSVLVPDNVHQLKPGDIDVVAALGDSMTAATAANAVNALEVGIDNRGLSFSIGGQGNFRTHLTIPNILKEFNPRLIGYSLKDASNTDRAAQFNLAENVATTKDMPMMAYKLLRRMRLDNRVNITRHWKLITIMIGGNDFCQQICRLRDSPLQMNQDQEENIIRTLRIIRDTMPRTFVNLVADPMVNLIISMDILTLSLPCRIGRAMFCSCLEGLRFRQSRDLYLVLEQNFKEILQNVVRRPEFQRDDFTVVYQPFGVNATVYIDNLFPDISIVAYDCIHFSQKGHAVAANALWNNMMQSESRKSVGLKPLFESFECPTEQNPYLSTYFNGLHEASFRVW